jgi:fatty acid desaturase
METTDRLSSQSIDTLRTAVADLETVNPWVGLGRFVSVAGVTLSLIALAWSADSPIGFVSYTAIAAIPYAFCLICTHDAVHHTLTGWPWVDELIARLVAYPMLWPHGIYSQLHRLHHGWNGIDLRDPERVQWTIAEYQHAHPWLQWYVRHQWPIDLLGSGGMGLIGKTVINSFRLQPQLPILRRMLLLDGLGIFGIQLICVLAAVRVDRIGDYILFWLVLERIMGVIIQARDHLEHYGLWGQVSGHQLTQLYASRNLTTHRLVGWLMGGLNYHAVHHAFPRIPFNQLPVAYERVQTILAQQHLPPLNTGRGYVQETLHLGTHPLLIGDPNVNNASGRYHILACEEIWVPVVSLEL